MKAQTEGAVKFQVLGANGRSLGAGRGTGWGPYSRFSARNGLFEYQGEDPRGRACSLSSPLGRSLCSCEAGGGWGVTKGGLRRE